MPSVVLSLAILNFSFAPAFAQRVVVVPKGGLAPMQGRGLAPVTRLVNGTVRYSPSALVMGKTLIQQGSPSVTTLPGETAVNLPYGAVTPSVELAQPGIIGQVPGALNSVVPQSVNEDAASVVESAAEEAPQAAQPGLITRLARAVTTRLSSGKMFDFSRPGASGLGILPHRPITLPNGVELDQPPAAPTSEQDSGISINSFGFPVERPSGAVMDEAPATVLQANPADEADVERALRSYIDENRSKYGIPSSDLKTIHVKRVNNEGKVPGVNQAETIYAYFHQQRNGLSVHTSFASFTIKILQGRPVLLAAQARLYPAIAAQTVPQFSDEDLLTRAQRRLEEIGAPPQIAALLEYFQQKIIYTAGSWRTASIYVLPGFPVMIAVDVVTGDAFIWDSRVGAEDARSLAGKLAGRGETSDFRPDGQAVISQQPLAHVSVTLEGGKKAVTDRNGRFTTSVAGGEAKFTATLSGKYAAVNDQSGKPLKVSASLKPGTETEVVYNPEGASELEVSQVNGYSGATRVHDYLKDHGIDDARIDKAIPVNVNIDDECNAYYTPGRPSLNFFKSSQNCSDTARPGIIAHEYGHFVDDMIGGIVNGGLSEGWGDIFSMYMLRSPIVGDGFLKNRTPSYIRHGENDYQYQQQDEVHDQGQAWMGFGWKLHKSLVAALSEAGAALAETLVLPTLFAKAADIPTAIAQVLLNDMDANGNMPHEEYIRAAAKAHGIEIPKTRIAALTQAAQQAAGMLQGSPAMNLTRRGPPDNRYLVTYRGIRPMLRGEFNQMRKALEKAGVRVVDSWGNTIVVEGDEKAIRGAVKKKTWTVSNAEGIDAIAQSERWTPAGKGISYARDIPVEYRAQLAGVLTSNRERWAALMDLAGLDILRISLRVKSATPRSPGSTRVVKYLEYEIEAKAGRRTRAVTINVGMAMRQEVRMFLSDLGVADLLRYKDARSQEILGTRGVVGVGVDQRSAPPTLRISLDGSLPQASVHDELSRKIIGFEDIPVVYEVSGPIVAQPAAIMSLVAPSQTSIRIVADAEITKHLDEASHLSSSWMSNRFIEAYYDKNKDRLSPSQVKRLLAGLSRNDSNSYGRADTYSRMADSYIVETAGRIPVADALALAVGAGHAWKTNSLIEKYFQLAKSLLSWDGVKALLAGLILNDSNSYGKADTQNRIILAWEEVSHRAVAQGEGRPGGLIEVESRQEALRQRLGRALLELGKFEQNPIDGKRFYIASDDDLSVRNAQGKVVGWSKLKIPINVFALKPNRISQKHILQSGEIFGATVAIELKPILSTGKPFRVSLREVTPYDKWIRNQPYVNWEKTLEMDYQELAQFVETMVGAALLKDIAEFQGMPPWRSYSPQAS